MTNMQPSYGVGRVAPATMMLMEDELKKMLTMTTGERWKPYANKNLPRSLHSPFGDFPGEYMKTMKKAEVTAPKDISSAQVSIAAKGTTILKKGMGTGGKCTSMAKPKPKPVA